MKQKLLIEVDSDKSIEKMKEHILLYDGKQKVYKAITREDFLNPVLDDIRKEKEELKKALDDLKIFRESLSNDNEAFRKEMLETFDKFIELYKQTNKKIIDLVKEKEEC